MTFLTVFITAVGLAMDAFSVSIVAGGMYDKAKVKHAVRLGLAFGGFQAIMPVLGWLGGISVKNYISEYDHWIAFALLGIIGGKMIYESFKIKGAQQKISSLSAGVVLLLALATSIDALAVGFTFSFLLAGKLVIAVIIIGVVTFLFSYAGFYIGKYFGHFFENFIEAIGGLILIGIGTKILLQHLFFG